MLNIHKVIDGAHSNTDYRHVLYLALCVLEEAMLDSDSRAEIEKEYGQFMIRTYDRVEESTGKD